MPYLKSKNNNYKNKFKKIYTYRKFAYYYFNRIDILILKIIIIFGEKEKAWFNCNIIKIIFAALH